MTLMARHIPVIGLLGGIASGKSFYSKLFAEAGCVVIAADELVSEIYRDAGVLKVFVSWWGEGVLNGDGTLSRAAVAKIVFSDPVQRARLEDMVHPMVRERRDQIMADPRNGGVRAFVWDIPLLHETGQDKMCDALVFVNTPREVREERARARGWGDGELERRESAQTSIETKRGIADEILNGNATLAEAKLAVAQFLDRVAPRVGLRS